MRLVVERGRTVPFEELPDRSLALDGYVQGPALDLERRRFSFDHHDHCVRLVTRATCQQVLDALLLGLDPSDLTVYVNDVDGDTALSVWLLRNQDRMREDPVRRLVESVGAIDAHGPAYPALEPRLADGFFAEAMAPEHDARQQGRYSTCDLRALLEECVASIDAYVAAGMPRERVREQAPYEVTHEGRGGWVMVHAEGAAFGELYADGYTRILSWRALDDGSWAYTVARKSDLVAGFPVGPASEPGTILHALAAEEPGWGGGSSIGGSPRNPDGSSSRMDPDAVFARVEELLGS